MARKKKMAPLPAPAPAPEAPPTGAAPPAPASPPAAVPAAPEPAPTQSRRVFLTRVGAAALLASGAGAAAAAVRFAVPETVIGAPERFPLGTPADFKVGTVTWLRERELFVMRDERGFGAFSSRCTHLGCTVRRTSEGYACPCHGARFDAAGAVVAGPARRALPWYAVALEADGRVWVDRSRARPAGTAPLRAAES